MKSRQSRQKCFVNRKHSSAGFAPVEDWTEEDDALFAGRRYAKNPAATTVNLTKLALLQEIFPEIEIELLQDILVAAQYQVDVAASMFGELLRETTPLITGDFAAAVPSSEDSDLIVLDVEMNDMDDDEDWSEVSTVVEHRQVEANPWVMVQDEWEVVDMEGEKVSTFAEILRRSGTNSTSAAAVPQLPKLSIVEFETSRAQKQKTLKKSANNQAPTYDLPERGVKSFGARKRRFLKTRA
jgi:CheY-like chemotaxis protein|uniref:CUE domain-containing protein n=1 Tax=Globisporangium ultimum (strain ATCC 200006 / CBS 805.95 / DAOM BR144) TaxID=431595 RepID=K3WWZ0_GLOUD